MKRQKIVRRKNVDLILLISYYLLLIYFYFKNRKCPLYIIIDKNLAMECRIVYIRLEGV
jgi:hypothetical protein